MTPEPSPIIVFKKTSNNTSSSSSSSPFTIGIKELVEIQENNAVGTLTVSNTTFMLSNYSSVETNSMQRLEINGTFSNGAKVRVTATSWTNSTTIEFAGRSITVAPYALKYTFEFSNWPFQSSSNRLQVVMQTLSSDANMTQTPTSVSDEDGNLLYFIVYVGDQALYCDLVPVVLVDGLPSNVSSSLSASGDLSMTIPYFASSAIVDPNYSILPDSSTLLGNNITSTSQPVNGGSHHLSQSGKIALAVILPFFFVAVVVGAVAYWYFRRQRREVHYATEMTQLKR